MARAQHLNMASIVVIGTAVQNLCVQVGPGVLDESAEEVFEQLGLQIANQADFDQILVDQRRAAAEIDRDYREGFIHGEYEVSGAVDAFAIAESLGEQLADHDAGVFDCVMLVDVEIAFGRELEIEGAVFGEELQHVIEEADAGRDLVPAAALDAEFAADLRFLCVALEFSRANFSAQLPPPGN